MTDTDSKPSYDELLMALDPKVRPAVAKARNSQIRARKHQEAWYAEVKELRAHIRGLRHRWGLSRAEIARVMDLSPTRIDQLTGKRT